MQIYMPFILTMIAGLSTLFGLIFIYIKNDYKIIKNSLAFASGVMICISVIDLIPESIILLNKDLSKNISFIYLVLFIILGLIIPLIIDKLLNKDKEKLYKLGLLSMIAIILHNLPEGIITFLSAQTNIKLGFKMTIAIALHNIPEGISIAVPIYYSTKNKFKAFIMTLLSALSEPVGGVVAFLFLKPIINNIIMGIIFAIIAGIMTCISLVELLPKALEYKNKNKTLLLFLIGIIFMIISIKLLN